MDLAEITRRLCREVGSLSFSAPVSWTYNPLDYARRPHLELLRRHGEGRKQVLLVGMNPGPWGMAQTGVPFGAVSMVREWLGIDDSDIHGPERQHPKRPVLGFSCTREEVSGTRLWGWARERWGTPERFFDRFWVTNYCPLLFLDGQGRNITPDKLSTDDRAALLEPCDRALRAIALALRVEWAIGVGAFAEVRVRRACDGLALRTGRVLHPSPASPAANRGWAPQATAQLRELGIEIPEAGVGDELTA
ncbi:MAG: single-stranded DNA-binding protein [Thermoanaerobaculia bacterium]|nr:single-stranded DNA-binding protein [Thermoanaerobaculia bacterium]